MVFLDPACGSGNFLTETYTSLRKLENEALRVLYEGQMAFGESFSPIQVHISQFYGIEINDFAVTVSRTALWIAESQMMKETEDIVGQSLDFLPLKSAAHIHEGNALRMDWNEVVPASLLNYIMGNPPFIGFTYMSSEQKSDMSIIFPKIKNLDYVSAWFKKASDYIGGTDIICAFVSTNSLCQGETASRLWAELSVSINFAYTTFKWENDTKDAAAVHCIIVGFSKSGCSNKRIFSASGVKKVRNINAYLIDGDDILVLSRNTPIYDVPKMIYGNKPADGGFLLLSEEEASELRKKEPLSSKWILPYIGAREFLHSEKRFCLWLDGAESNELAKCPEVLKRVAKVKGTREASIAAGIRKFASTPSLFAQRTQPISKPYILVPRVSSERRDYVPMAFMPPQTVASDAVQIIPTESKYVFGVMTSSVHMAWMRTVAGRLEMRYRYSKDIVYNNFPWPNLTDKQKQKIEETAQAILKARAAHPESSLADLYDPLTMPEDLRQAHEANDKAVKKAYGFKPSMSEPEIVAELFRLYDERVKELEKEAKEAKEKAKAEKVATSKRRKRKNAE